MSRKKILDRAFQKCAFLQPGQTVELTEAEEAVLQEAIRAHRENCPECQSKKGYLKIHPFTKADIERFRKLGLPSY